MKALQGGHLNGRQVKNFKISDFHAYTRTEIKIDIIQIRYGGYEICVYG